MFASNFTVDNSYIKHLRGEDNLTRWGQDKTPTSGTEMSNYFCTTCGTLMYRRSALSPHLSFMRIGTVDDFTLHETKLRPQTEIFTSSRVSWWHGVEGANKFSGTFTKANM
ncbi:Mss4-like protein [Trichoderma barbatum]